MKNKLAALSRRYLAALRNCVRATAGAPLAAAQRLGQEAVALGLDTPDLARLHELSLASLVLTKRSSTARLRLARFAEIFLAGAKREIEKTPRAETGTNPPGQTLTQHTAQLAATNRVLKQGLRRHKTAEAVLRTSGRHNTKMLLKSQRLQSHLRDLFHQLVSAQESERTKISHELQDEVAQTLLGINARLLTLKKAAADGDTENLRNEIASTQRAVKDSIHSINRFARELDLPSLLSRTPSKPC